MTRSIVYLFIHKCQVLSGQCRRHGDEPDTLPAFPLPPVTKSSPGADVRAGLTPEGRRELLGAVRVSSVCVRL